MSPKEASDKFVAVTAEAGVWHGISQKQRLEPKKKYTVSLRIRGASCEVHCGAWDGTNFLGWHNAAVPGKEWAEIRFDFYTRESAADTTLYFNVLNREIDVTVCFDSIEVRLE